MTTINIQPIEKRDYTANGVLDVHSIFYTIQGEGPFCGTPAIFIRLAGCNLQCPGCDTDYTSHREWMTPNEILEQCLSKGLFPGLVVITGGEPFRQDIAPLVIALVKLGCYVQVETNGTLAPPLGIEWNRDIGQRTGAYIVCSPKAGKVNSQTDFHACAYKYVVKFGSVRTDGLPVQALDHTAVPFVARPSGSFKGLIYLQPMDEQDPIKNRLNLDVALSACLQKGYILQLQVHKIIGME